MFPVLVSFRGKLAVVHKQRPCVEDRRSGSRMSLRAADLVRAGPE